MTDLAQDTEGLIARATLGDPSARRDLLEHYRDYLRRMVAARLDRRLAPRVDASDVVQETLADAARRLDGYLADPPLPFFGWLRVLAGEHIREAHRQHLSVKGRSVARECRFSEFDDPSRLSLARCLAADDTTPSNRLAREDAVAQVHAALANLPGRDRDVLVMRYVEGLTHAEISVALGAPEATVRSRAYRALLQLQNRLEAR